MVAQSPPYAEQNGQHDARLFRLATFSAFRDTSGVVGPGDLAVSAQSTPNMSIQVGAGRVWIKGTQLASVPGGTWSTQGAYYGYNDAPVTLTVAAADPTNPRIDAVVAYVLDAFYSGASNLFVLGVVTGTPAPSPSTPAVPSNGLLLGTLAVAANATSISSGNISQTGALQTVTRGGILPVLSTDTTAGTFVGQYRDHPTNGAERWDGSKWSTVMPLGQWVTAYQGAGNYSFSLPSAYADVTGSPVTVTVPAGRTLDVEVRIPHVRATNGADAALILIINGTESDIAEVNPVGNQLDVPVKLQGSLTNTGTASATWTVNVKGSSTGGSGTLLLGTGNVAGDTRGPRIRSRLM